MCVYIGDGWFEVTKVLEPGGTKKKKVLEVTKVLELHADRRHVGCLHVELHDEAA